MTYLKIIQALMNKITKARIKVKDDDAINQIFHGLQTSYKTFISTIGNQLKLTLSIIFGKLQQEEIMNE
jgi:phosphotransferase system IIB component